MKNNKIVSWKISMLEGITGDNNEENTPAQPNKIIPKYFTIPAFDILTIPHNTFTIVQIP